MWKTDDQNAPPISDYAVIGDCRCCALISRSGSVDWCCFERFDHCAVFSRLLDWERGGAFVVRPTIPFESSRRYLPGTNVLETRFETARGSLVLTDAFGLGPPGVEQDAPPQQLIRLFHAERGTVPVEVIFRPRFDYGLTVPRCAQVVETNWIAYGGADALFLESDLVLERVGSATLRGCLELTQGDRKYAAVRQIANKDQRIEPIGEQRAEELIADAIRFWREWISHLQYQGPYADLVMRSALVLKALTYRPSGAIVAAPTASLPEWIGGSRNWDYRYTWVRDSSMHLGALFELGYTEEAHQFMDWLKRTTAARAEDLQVAYGIGGEHLIPEFELDTLSGYRGSRPVRIGNGASRQFQLDAYGHVVIAACKYVRHGGRLEPDFWEFICEIIDQVERRWQEPDHGIWEVRTPPQHFVSSKALAWAAADAAIGIAAQTRHEADLGRWTGLRDQIRAAIEANGIDAATGAFMQAFDVREPDASTLQLPLVGFVDANDPRVTATIQWIESRLSRGALVWRYRNHDGLPGPEGPFVLASFWLIIVYAMRRDLGRAHELMQDILSRCNDVGLLGEQVDESTGHALGNFPQAFSHLGLVTAAVAIARAESALRAGPSTR